MLRRAGLEAMLSQITIPRTVGRANRRTDARLIRRYVKGTRIHFISTGRDGC